MSSLIVIVYRTEAKAEEVRSKLFGQQRESLISLDDAVIATKVESCKVKLNQIHSTTAAGSAQGSLWGLLIGLLFLNPLLGVAVGATSGACFRTTDDAPKLLFPCPGGMWSSAVPCRRA